MPLVMLPLPFSVCLATEVENMICASADLSNSDKTDGFLKKTHSLRRGDFYNGCIFQAGVAEPFHGLHLHRYGSSWRCDRNLRHLRLLDYMKPALRMATHWWGAPWSSSGLTVLSRVGEDGPTHEPVEQEAQVRLLEKLRLTADIAVCSLKLHPADAIETTVAETGHGEHGFANALILSVRTSRIFPAKKSEWRALKPKVPTSWMKIPKPDVTLVASGSVLHWSKALHCFPRWRYQGSHRVRSGEGLFRSQDKAYQDSVLPKGARSSVWQPDYPSPWKDWSALIGKVWGLETFGYSAPLKVLDELRLHRTECL